MDAVARWAPAAFSSLLRKVFLAKVGVEWAYVLAPQVVIGVLMVVYRVVPDGLKARAWFVFSGAAPKRARASA